MKSFEPFSGFLNHECGDFSILVRVIYLMSIFNIVEGSYRTNKRGMGQSRWEICIDWRRR
jgi:hypothetical protein